MPCNENIACDAALKSANTTIQQCSANLTSANAENRQVNTKLADAYLANSRCDLMLKNMNDTKIRYEKDLKTAKNTITQCENRAIKAENARDDCKNNLLIESVYNHLCKLPRNALMKNATQCHVNHKNDVKKLNEANTKYHNCNVEVQSVELERDRCKNRIGTYDTFILKCFTPMTRCTKFCIDTDRAYKTFSKTSIEYHLSKIYENTQHVNVKPGGPTIGCGQGK